MVMFSPSDEHDAGALASLLALEGTGRPQGRGVLKGGLGSPSHTQSAPRWGAQEAEVESSVDRLRVPESPLSLRLRALLAQGPGHSDCGCRLHFGHR